MEDASIHINNFPTKNHYLFGVFDGHGGAEVAQYVQKHFSLELYLNKKFKEKRYDEALIETFNKMDFIMQSPIGRKELKEIIEKLVSEGNRSKAAQEHEFAGCTANVCYVTDT
jgi:protein phosphatase 1G